MAQYLGNEGMVMLYAPRDTDELDVILQLIMDSCNFVTGRKIPSPAEGKVPGV